MAYDRSQRGHDVVTVSGGPPDYRLEVGPAYIPVGEAREFMVLDPDRAATLRAWSDALIPRRGDRPAAGEIGAAEYIDATVFKAPRLRALLLTGIDTIERLAMERQGRSFTECRATDQIALLHEFELADWDGTFKMVQAFTYEAYYAHPDVLAILEKETGWGGSAPTTGSPMQPFDEELLARVKTLPALYWEARE
jgi:hypothetical protein